MNYNNELIMTPTQCLNFCQGSSYPMDLILTFHLKIETVFYCILLHTPDPIFLNKLLCYKHFIRPLNSIQISINY